MAKAIMEILNSSLPFEKRVIYFKENESVRIGRLQLNEAENKTNALFRSKSMSGTHAYLTYATGKFMLEDRSKNGTFVNGYKLLPRKKYPLTSGDIIELGTEAFFNEDNGIGIIIFIKLFCLEEEELRTQSTVQELYPHPVQIYCNPPLFDFNREALQICASERFSVLQIISNVQHRDMKTNIWIQEVVNKIKNCSVNFYEMITGALVSSKVELIQRQSDHVSHYILLMACCKKSTTSKWFINLESKLLHIRWHFLSKTEKKEFIRINNLSFQKLSNRKKLKMADIYTGFISPELDYFQVPFEDLSHLVGQREVIINKGIAFVTFDELIYPIVTYFSKSLETRLKIAKKNYHKGQWDERIAQLVVDVRRLTEIENQPYNIERMKKISYLDIDQLCKESFPLCMERLHLNLSKNSHLRNGGRYQYILFLKGIGVSLHDAITFWRNHFTKKISSAQFKKKYLYHIRHCYGKVGKQADYPPLNCKKILEASPGPLDVHGCPYKTENKHGIMELLEQKGINEADAIKVWELMQAGLPQIACNKVFELLHSFSPSDSTSHPNIYYVHSRKTFEGGANTSFPVMFSCKQNNCACESFKLEW